MTVKNYTRRKVNMCATTLRGDHEISPPFPRVMNKVALLSPLCLHPLHALS